MKKNRLVFLGFPLIAAMTVACSGIELNGGEDGQTEIVTEEASTSEEATEATSEAETEETAAADDAEFYYLDLKENAEEKVDLGSDGQMDTLFFKHPDGSGSDNSCSLKVNDQTIDIELLVENGVIMGDANAFLAHRSDGDFVMITEGGAMGYGNLTLYMWDKDSLKEVGKIDDQPVNIYSTYDTKANSDKYEIYADKIVISSLENFFGCDWIGARDCKYDGGGLELVREEKVYPIINGADAGLILKKDVEFMDDSGEAPKTAKKGQKIIPYDINGSCMGFKSEDGEFLGYLQDDNGEELFENIGNFQVG
ncbi:MAG: hypothetical protein J5802_13420 [Butyrivibrio sp.]|nr:hypothetical protein [Butyrivibrio sp.]